MNGNTIVPTKQSCRQTNNYLKFYSCKVELIVRILLRVYTTSTILATPKVTFSDFRQSALTDLIDIYCIEYMKIDSL